MTKAYTYNLFTKPVWLLFVVAVACRERYTPPLINANAKFLVVEGFINVGDAPTSITLTTTIKVSDTPNLAPMVGALVKVQGDDGGSYNLNEVMPGVYAINAINGSAAAKYRLYIAANGKEYQSDYVAYKATPVIDSVSWEQQDDGVHIYANAHDATGNTRYYQWDFVETYEYHANFDAEYTLENYVPVQLPYGKHLYKCWHTINSTRLLTYSTVKLADDIVYKGEVQFIPASTRKLGQLYTIFLHQHAITEQAYSYLQQMSKNTENIGSLFDAQPSVLQGNIHCVTDASEIVVGFVTASSLQQQRIFIAKNQLKNWLFPPYPYSVCDTVNVEGREQTYTRAQEGYIPIGEFMTGKTFASTNGCTDCRTEGGDTSKPAFWP